MLFRRYVGDIIGYFICPSFDPSVLLRAQRKLLFETQEETQAMWLLDAENVKLREETRLK